MIFTSIKCKYLQLSSAYSRMGYESKQSLTLLYATKIGDALSEHKATITT